MSYIDMINAFWNWRKVNELSSKGTDLFFALLDCANTCAWKAEFTAPNSMLMAMCQMSRTDLFRCRNTLIQKGLIAYKPGRKGQAGLYSILTSSIFGTYSGTNLDISPKYGTHSGTHSGTNPGTNSGTHSGPIHRQDKTRQEKENSPNGEQKKVAKVSEPDRSASFTDAIFAEVYQAWERASGKCASIAQSEELQILLEEHGRENMLYAIKQGVNHNAVTLAYIKAVLKGNKSSGKRDKQEKSYIPNKQGKFADITDDLL